jgi:hypothetical protein
MCFEEICLWRVSCCGIAWANDVVARVRVRRESHLGSEHRGDLRRNGSRGEVCLGLFVFVLPSCAISEGSMRRRKIRLYMCSSEAVGSRTGLSVEKRSAECRSHLRNENMCRAYTAALRSSILRTQGFHPGLGVCRAYGAGARLKSGTLLQFESSP